MDQEKMFENRKGLIRDPPNVEINASSPKLLVSWLPYAQNLRIRRIMETFDDTDCYFRQDLHCLECIRI